MFAGFFPREASALAEESILNLCWEYLGQRLGISLWSKLVSRRVSYLSCEKFIERFFE